MTALRDYGDTDLSTDLLWQLCRHIEPDPFLDGEAFEHELEQLHQAAFPQASSRPPRLTVAAGGFTDLRE